MPHPKNEWWTEGTATWAEHFVENDCPRAQVKADAFIKKFSRDELADLDDPYASWVWPLWIERKAGGTAAITDAGLGHLRNLRNLATLILHHTKVTQAGVRSLQRSLPETQIDD